VIDKKIKAADLKTIILLGDGMADYPLAELDGRTPLEAARTPNLDRIAAGGTLGLVRTVKPGFPPGSDVANMAVLGLDPGRYYSGRAPIEAVSIGVALGENDTAFRINLVTITNSAAGPIMEDYCSEHISTAEAGELIEALKPRLTRHAGISLYRGVEYRHLMVIGGFDHPALQTTPPHDITGSPIEAYLPNDALLKELIKESMEVLKDHPINQARAGRGQRMATAVWPWGAGKGRHMPTLKEEFGLSGAMISAVDLCKGLGKLRGMEVINVKGATGWIDTDYIGKAEAALAALKRHDLVYVHIEAPDEAGHGGLLKEKIQAIEDIDAKVLGTMLRRLETQGWAYRILFMPDHPTPIPKRTHTADPVPFLVYESTEQQGHPGRRFTEKNAVQAGLFIEAGYELLGRLLRSQSLG